MIPEGGNRFLDKIMPKKIMLALALALLTAGAAAAQDLSVVAVNASKRTRCAETDNINVTLQSPEVGSFRIEAVHPHYLKSLTADSTAPDFKTTYALEQLLESVEIAPDGPRIALHRGSQVIEVSCLLRVCEELQKPHFARFSVIRQ